jgi:hypothetical protein
MLADLKTTVRCVRSDPLSNSTPWGFRSQGPRAAFDVALVITTT